MDALATEAMGLWPELASQMGEDPGSWTAKVIAKRSDSRVQMVVLSLNKADRRLVLKWQKSPIATEDFAKSIHVQIQAAEVFETGVPAVHAIDLERQACVMDFAGGLPLAVAIQNGTPEEKLQQAGQWLDRFHRTGLAEPRVFQPKYTINYLRQILTEINQGIRTVLDRSQFERCAAALIDRQPVFEGRVTQAATPHGDLHMRNLIMGEVVTGIDFRGGNPVPVGHDIGRLLADVAILWADHATVPPGQVLPSPLMDAFFAGYTLVGPDDPSVQLLMRHRFLAEWWGLPADIDRLSMAQFRRWQGIQSLYPRIFPAV